MLLEGKIAIVTGAARVIGKAIAKIYSQNGAKVALCDIMEEQAMNASGEIRNMTGYEKFAQFVDVTNKLEIESAVRKVMDLFGRIDILVMLTMPEY